MYVCMYVCMYDLEKIHFAVLLIKVYKSLFCYFCNKLSFSYNEGSLIV